MKVSFDFDGTLTKRAVQEYAELLIEKGYEVWIVTSRLSEEEARKCGIGLDWNKDLYEVSDSIGIDRKNIKFCSMTDKYEFFKDKDFIFHLDDDNIEVDMINEYTNTMGIKSFGNPNWVDECNNAIKHEF